MHAGRQAVNDRTPVLRMVIDVCVLWLVPSDQAGCLHLPFPKIDAPRHALYIYIHIYVDTQDPEESTDVPSATSGGNVHDRCSILRLRIMITIT